ncbi:hypothetical cytosolic protein [Syntrophus aciditrophicus SB]|uniref:Hypothetical cytosolic protein n=1 Tax=Syntrophus aciditrophicus (strain SB) TaxID=56780 RepID=Q2LWD9_SYNAS|nr:hypothetical cytosolic protein [Syntrophus aciditrophicus SB]
MYKNQQFGSLMAALKGAYQKKVQLNRYYWPCDVQEPNFQVLTTIDPGKRAEEGQAESLRQILV